MAFFCDKRRKINDEKVFWWLKTRFIVSNEGFSELLLDVTCCCCERIYFPNAFSPNSDDLNDAFRATGIFTGLLSWDLSIWNRYGEMLFKSSAPLDGWNGRKNNVGEAAAAGAYVYRLVTENRNHELVSHEGVFVLLR